MKNVRWIGLVVLLIGFVPRLAGCAAAAWENSGAVALNHAFATTATVPDSAQTEWAWAWLEQAGTPAAAYQLGLLAVWQDRPLTEPLSAAAASQIGLMLTSQAGQWAAAGVAQPYDDWYARAQALAIPLPAYWLEVGKGYALRREWAAAAAAFEKAIAAAPGAQEGWYQLGAAYLELGRHAEAVPVLQQALTVEPSTVPRSILHHTLGLAYLPQTGNDAEFAAARHAFQTALDTNQYGDTGFYTESLYQIGLSYTLENEWERAIPYFEQVLAQMPDHYAAHVNLGRAYWKMGDNALGLHFGQTAITINPSVIAAYLLVSDIYRAADDLAQAQPYFAQAYALAPDDPQILARLPYFPPDAIRP